MDRVRVIRVLEYVGTRAWVEFCLEGREINGTRRFREDCIIREAFLGDFPEITEEEIKSSRLLTEKEMTFMIRFGWELDQQPATKHDHQSGKVLAHEGDETWDRDLKVAGE